MPALLLAASVTPLRDGGARLDEGAIEPLARFLIAGGVDGVFALGTTGEGVLLGLDERRTAAERFREARAGSRNDPAGEVRPQRHGDSSERGSFRHQAIIAPTRSLRMTSPR